MQQIYELAREIRREVEAIQDVYRRGKGPTGLPLDRSDERYVIEDTITQVIKRELAGATWNRG
jgi:hypothetical protein